MSEKFIMQMRPRIGSEEKEAIYSYMQEDGFLTEFKNTKGNTIISMDSNSSTSSNIPYYFISRYGATTLRK